MKTSTNIVDTEDVVIIGAGATGLSIAHALHRFGIRALILEKDRKIAASWRGRHPQLRLNTHRWLSSLPGLPLPRAAGAFPTRDAIIDYLERYAETTGARIRFTCEVAGLYRENDNWLLDTTRGRIRARHLVFATGREREPSIPQWPGLDRWRGQLVHSAQLSDITQYEDKRVLVVGAGNSGTDALNHLATIRTRSLHVSMRHGSYFLPTRLLGFPVHLGSVLMSLLPPAWADRLLAATERAAFGDLTRYGLPRSRSGAASRLAQEGVAPAIDNGFIRALKAGRAGIVSEVVEFDETGVWVADGRRIEPDIVITATGYRTGLDTLLGHLGVLDPKGLPRINAAGGAIDAPFLWFAGMYPQLTGNFWVCRRNSTAMARAIRDQLRAVVQPVSSGSDTGSHEPSSATLVAAE